MNKVGVEKLVANLYVIELSDVIQLITCWNRTGVVTTVSEEERFRHILSVLSPTLISWLKTPTGGWNEHR